MDASRCCLFAGRCEGGPDDEDDDAGEAKTEGCLADRDEPQYIVRLGRYASVHTISKTVHFTLWQWAARSIRAST